MKITLHGTPGLRRKASVLATGYLVGITIALGAGPTTTLGTRGSTSTPNPAIVANDGAAWTEYTRPADHPRIHQYPLEFITLRSGQKLGVLVTVPADEQGRPVDSRFPAILTQTAYRIDLGNAIGAVLPAGNTLLIGGADQAMIERGYVSVAVDTLGSGVSDGEQQPFSAEEQQAYGETVNWVLRQKWSDGQVGVAGTSYLGIDALMTAAQGHPAVKAVFAQVPMADAWRDTIGTGGMLNSLFLSSWLPLTQNLSVKNAAQIKAHPRYAEQIAAATQEHIDATYHYYLPLINDALNGTPGIATDGEYWETRSVIEDADRIRVPTFIVGATVDIFQRGEPLLYEQLKRNVTTKLLILPGSHLASITTTVFNSADTRQGIPSSRALLLQWFDRYLKGMDTGAEKIPNVTQFIDGYGDKRELHYASTTDWPHPLARPQRLYLHGDKRLLSAELPGDGEATHTVAEPPAPEVIVTTSADGTLLQGTHISNDGSDCSISYVQWTLGLGAIEREPCFTDSNTVEEAQGAINYETAPMRADYYLNGPMQANVWISSTVTEAAVSVRVDDVAPDGTARPISNGLLSAAYRAVDRERSRYIDGEMIQPWHPFTVESRLPVVPGEAMELPVEIFPAAALVRAGHRLRISISASNQAQGIWPYPSQALANGGVTTIYADAAHPSNVVLPAVPSKVLH